MPAKKTKEEILELIDDRNERDPDKSVTIVDDFEYEGMNQKIKVKCKNDHEWSTSIKFLINGNWCPICSRKEVGDRNAKGVDSLLLRINNRNKINPDKAVRIKDVSQYSAMNKKMTFICANNHEWNAIPKTVVNGSYCPECRRLSNIERDTYTHDHFLSVLEERNKRRNHNKVYLHAGEVYKRVEDRLLFICDKGHVWRTQAKNVIQSDSGCPICANKGFSYKAIEWIESIERIEGIKIRHRGNSEEEFRIPSTKYKVDGYCEETNTVYEFYGDFWHGNPAVTIPSEINPACNTSYSELYGKTMQRERNIRNLGYSIVVMWENDWDMINRSRYEFGRIVNKACFNNRAVLNSDILGDDLPTVDLYDEDTSTAINLCTLNEWQEQKLNSRNLNKRMVDRSLEIGVRLVVFFEDEWNNNRQLILDKLSYIASITELSKIYARKCTVHPIESRLKSNFLNQNHIQGNDKNCTATYGAFFEDELVAVMTFVKPRIFMKGKDTDKEGVYELSRFASANDKQIVGIAGKLLKRFEDDFNPEMVFSFADRRWSIGNLYDKLGFDLDRINPPEYFYIINGERKHRWQFRKDALKTKLKDYDPGITEYQNMLNHGYDRVWGAGTMKFVKTYPTIE